MKLKPTVGYEIWGVWDGRTTGPDGRVGRQWPMSGHQGRLRNPQNKAPSAAAGTFFTGSQAARDLGILRERAGRQWVRNTWVLLCRKPSDQVVSFLGLRSVCSPPIKQTPVLLPQSQSRFSPGAPQFSAQRLCARGLDHPGPGLVSEPRGRGPCSYRFPAAEAQASHASFGSRALDPHGRPQGPGLSNPNVLLCGTPSTPLLLGAAAECPAFVPGYHGCVVFLGLSQDASGHGFF